jgi:putative ABC transport system permease protein
MRRLIFFLRTFKWFSGRNLRRHFGRALVVLCGIALGAAVFTSVRISVHASLDSFTRSMDFFAGKAEKVLVRPGGYVPEEVLPILRRHPRVLQTSVLMTIYVREFEGTSDPFMLIGFDPTLDRSFRNWRLQGESAQTGKAWVDLIREPNTLLLTETLARELELVPGTKLSLECTRSTAEFRVLGTLALEGLALVEGGRVALTDIATLQEFTGLFGVVDRIDLTFLPKTSEQDLEQLLELLPATLELKSPSGARDSGTAMIRAYQLNLSVLSFASLFVGMFLVYSLVALNAAARRRELAILRALGGSSRLVFLLVLAEGAVFGLAGWLIAIPLSTFLVKHLLDSVSATISTLFVRVHVESLALSFPEILISFGITLLVAVLAALPPAREAMNVAPREALSISRAGAAKPHSAGRFARHACACLLLCVPLSLVPGISGVPIPGYGAILLLFAGFSLLAPWLLRQLGRAASPVVRRVAGLPAYLAGRYLHASDARTAISVGALITAVALFTALVVMIHSFRSTVELWVAQTVSGDLFVTNKMGQINRFRFPIPEDLVQGLKQMNREADLVESRRYQMTQNGYPYEFEAMGMETFLKYGGFIWLKGDPEKARPLLERGEGLLISEVFSNRCKLDVGDLFQAQIEGSLVEIPVVGIVRDYRTDGGVVFYSWRSFKERYHDPQWSGVRFFLKDRSADPDAAVARLRNLIITQTGGRLDMISGRELRDSVLQIFDETFAVTTVLLLIALAVAALGIATTLMVMVLDRRQQLNTLLAIGASPGQIRAMILWEGAFLAAAGELAGLVCGFILSYLLVYVINRQSFGWTFLYAVDWGTLALSLPLVVLTALAAALPAMRLAFRDTPAALLRER